MFKRIKNYFEQRRIIKGAKKTIGQLTTVTSSAQPEFWIKDGSDHSLSFTINSDTIFSITQDGEALWHDKTKYNEAASIFLAHCNLQIEDSAGIARNRKEWEQRIREALIVEAEKAPLTADALTNVLNKCIMYDKLKGIDSGNE